MELSHVYRARMELDIVHDMEPEGEFLLGKLVEIGLDEQVGKVLLGRKVLLQPCFDLVLLAIFDRRDLDADALFESQLVSAFSDQ